MKTLLRILTVPVLLLVAPATHSQFQIGSFAGGEDPCGYPDTSTAQYKFDALLNWGYSYDSLRADLGRWSQSPFVQIDSVGASVQDRALYVLTIQDTSTPAFPRKRIWMHARTHPNEVQGTWVTNEVIRFLLSPATFAKRLRDSCVFNIMPMYNPDGVELAKPRENANNIDIESNWSANPSQPEVQVLRRVFTGLMTQPNPVRVMLNMHSAWTCKRYFVYHTAAGTSNLFATMQQNFINAVRGHFPGGFEPYMFFVSWPSNPPPTYYPESWFWYNHREAVLANTYEDKNCASAGGFDSTALAILQGVGDHLGISGPTSISNEEVTPSAFSLGQNYPNPFNPTTVIRFRVGTRGHTSLQVFDILGRDVATIVNEELDAGNYLINFSAKDLASGVYFYKLTSGNSSESKRMTILK